MLKKFTLKNYKNFKDEISIDFENTAGYQFSTDCITDGIISKMLIYGRNATGKTNLGKALMDINKTMFGGRNFYDTGIFLNADSIDKTAIFSYEFCFENNELVYRYARLSNQDLRKEELLIDGKTIFSCDFENNKFYFENLEYINAETANVDRYKQSVDSGDDEEFQVLKLPFLTWLLSNVALSNDSILIKLANYARRMLMITAGNEMLRNPRITNDSFYELLEDSNRLKDLEDFLNEMGIKCKLILEKTTRWSEKVIFPA